MKKTVGVFFGGMSPEHEVSILTGVQAYHAVSRETYDVVPIFVNEDGLLYTGNKLTEIINYKNKDLLLSQVTQVNFLKTDRGVVMKSNNWLNAQKKIDCALLAFHGEYGEGGAFQGFCGTLGLPYTSSKLFGAAACMDKAIMKKLLKQEQVSVVNSYEASSHTPISEIEQKLNYPLFVKPALGGSSIGVNRVTNTDELTLALEVACAYGPKVLIEEEFIKDAEVNISYLGDWNGKVDVSDSEEVYSENQFLDFENKYLKGAQSKKITGSKGMASTQRVIPAAVPDVVLEKIISEGEKAFRALGCSGLVRIDFLVNKKTEEFVLVEVNTIPGSFAYYLWETKGISFSRLLGQLIELAFSQAEARKKYSRKTSSQIIKYL